jgi:hypothetical protein
LNTPAPPVVIEVTKCYVHAKQIAMEQDIAVLKMIFHVHICLNAKKIYVTINIFYELQ